MYINVAYSADKNPNIEDLTVPLRINNCGYYRVYKSPIIKTEHPKGRNDYQLLYIAHGKEVFEVVSQGWIRVRRRSRKLRVCIAYGVHDDLPDRYGRA